MLSIFRRLSRAFVSRQSERVQSLAGLTSLPFLEFMLSAESAGGGRGGGGGADSNEQLFQDLHAQEKLAAFRSRRSRQTREGGEEAEAQLAPFTRLSSNP